MPADVPGGTALGPAGRSLFAAGAGNEVFPREGMEKLIAASGIREKRAGAGGL